MPVLTESVVADTHTDWLQFVIEVSELHVRFSVSLLNTDEPLSVFVPVSKLFYGGLQE